MTQPNLLLLNIAATLTRMAATILMGLWTTRIAYQHLGETGFGVYASAVSLVAMLIFNDLSSVNYFA